MILGVIQCRMSSKRLPGKVLKTIHGIPMLLIMLDRVRQAHLIDRLIVATSTDKTDDPIRDFCKFQKVEYFRGDLDDVLSRFFWVTQICYPTQIVRMTGDCPLIDAEIIDKVIEHHISGNYDYTWNPKFPDGLDVEVMTHTALAQAFREANRPEEREHVTLYFRNNPDLFKIGRYECGTDLSHVKLSVDTEEDFYRVSRFIDLCLGSTMGYLNEYCNMHN